MFVLNLFLMNSFSLSPKENKNFFMYRRLRSLNSLNCCQFYYTSRTIFLLQLISSRRISVPSSKPKVQVQSVNRSSASVLVSSIPVGDVCGISKHYAVVHIHINTWIAKEGLEEYKNDIISNLQHGEGGFDATGMLRRKADKFVMQKVRSRMCRAR